MWNLLFFTFFPSVHLVVAASHRKSNRAKQQQQANQATIYSDTDTNTLKGIRHNTKIIVHSQSKANTQQTRNILELIDYERSSFSFFLFSRLFRFVQGKIRSLLEPSMSAAPNHQFNIEITGNIACMYCAPLSPSFFDEQSLYCVLYMCNGHKGYHIHAREEKSSFLPSCVYIIWVFRL